MYFLLLVILTVVILILLPFLVLFVKGFRMYRSARKFMKNVCGTDDDDYDTSGRQKRRTEPRPDKKRKKIDPEIGEYIAFEEITVSETTSTENTSSGTGTQIKAEAQVVDIEWEDIPENK